MTPDPFADLWAAAEKATPGPWFSTAGAVWIDTREQVCCGRGVSECCGEPDVIGGQEHIAESCEFNATFIAAANPSTILALRDELMRLRTALVPFGAAGTLLPPASVDDQGRLIAPDSTVIITLGNAPGPYQAITYGDLRTASQATKD